MSLDNINPKDLETLRRVIREQNGDFKPLPDEEHESRIALDHEECMQKLRKELNELRELLPPPAGSTAEKASEQ